MADIINDIENILVNFLVPQTQQIQRKYIFNLIPLLKKEAILLQQRQNLLLGYDRAISFYQEMGFHRTSAIALMYYNKEIIDIISEEKKLEQELIKAYQLVNKIRQIFTNEKIDYQIAAGSKTNQKLFQTKASFQQLKPLLNIQHRSEGYSIRINLTQQNVKQIQLKQNQEGQRSAAEIDNFSQGGSTLYSAVYRYYKDEKLWGGKGTFGDMYQAYRQLYFKSPEKKKNDWNPPGSQIAKALNRVVSGGGKKESFLTGGDNPFQQDKSGYGSRATLTTVSSTSHALEDLADGLQNFLQTNSTQSLKKMLTRYRTGSKVFNTAQKEARDYLDDLFKSISKN